MADTTTDATTKIPSDYELTHLYEPPKKGSRLGEAKTRPTGKTQRVTTKQGLAMDKDPVVIPVIHSKCMVKAIFEGCRARRLMRSMQKANTLEMLRAAQENNQARRLFTLLRLCKSHTMQQVSNLHNVVLARPKMQELHVDGLFRKWWKVHQAQTQKKQNDSAYANVFWPKLGNIINGEPRYMCDKEWVILMTSLAVQVVDSIMKAEQAPEELQEQLRSWGARLNKPGSLGNSYDIVTPNLLRIAQQ